MSVEPHSAQVRSISEARLPDRLLLGVCEVDLKAHSVQNGPDECRLTPKAAGVLRYMVARPGKAVTREELLDDVWRDAYPTDDVLSHAVTELRRALGDNPRSSTFIETIPKVGYRLMITPEFPSLQEEEGAQRGDPSSGRFLGAMLASALAGAIIGAGVMRVLIGNPDSGGQFIASDPPLSGAFPVTAETGAERMPDISADGQQVVYAAETVPEEGYDLFVKSLGSDSAMRLTETPGASEFTPTWSPDGKQVAFYRFEGESCGLFIKPLMGGFERRLSDCAADAITYIDWSPDGSTIAMTGRLGEQSMVAGILLLDVASGQLSKLDYQTATSEHDVQPRYSPDGESILFRRGAFPRSELFVVGAAGGEVRQLTDIGSQIRGFDWLPAGDKAWFCSDQSGRPGLFELDIADGATRLLEFGCPHMLSIAEDVPVMVYEYIEEDPNIIETIIAPGGQHVALPMFSSTLHESDPAYAPDGRQVVYVSDRTGQDQLWIGDLVTESNFQLTSHAALKLIRPRWSPDGEFVYYIGRGGGHEVLFRINVRSGVMEQLSRDEERVRSADVSADGRSVFLSSNMSGDWEIWALDLESGDYRRVTRSGGHRPMDPGDGYIYYTKLNVFGLWRLPLDAEGDEQLVSEDVQFFNHEYWVITDLGLYLPLADSPDEMSIYRIDIHGSGLPHRMLRIDSAENMTLHDVSADGERFLMTRIREPRQDIMAVKDW